MKLVVAHLAKYSYHLIEPGRSFLYSETSERGQNAIPHLTFTGPFIVSVY